MQKRVMVMKLDKHVYPSRKAIVNSKWRRAVDEFGTLT
jgi:hypothetical protein